MDPVILISIAVFLGVATLIVAIAFLTREFNASTAEERLEVITGKKTRETGSKQVTREELLRESVLGLSGVLSSFSSRLGSLSTLLEQSNSPIKADAFFGLSVGFCAVGVALAVVGHAPAPMYPVAGLVFGALPWLWLISRRKKRFSKFGKQLPDALELIGRALRSGHSLASGLHVVVEEMPDPISGEFGHAYEEQNLGVPIEQALKNMLSRMPNMDLKFFVTAVAIQRQAGGDMAEILDKISYIIRERFKILGQVQALTGEGRISGVVLMGLPIALFFAVYYLNPDYVMLLFTNELGRKMIALAGILQVLGAICIKKIVNIKI